MFHNRDNKAKLVEIYDKVTHKEHLENCKVAKNIRLAKSFPRPAGQSVTKCVIKIQNPKNIVLNDHPVYPVIFYIF